MLMIPGPSSTTDCKKFSYTPQKCGFKQIPNCDRICICQHSQLGEYPSYIKQNFLGSCLISCSSTDETGQSGKHVNQSANYTMHVTNC